MEKVLDLHIPGIRLDVFVNKREHFMVKARKTKAQRATVHYSLMELNAPKPVPPMRVILTRSGPRRIDSDNCTSSCKAVRDAIAHWMKVDDGHREITWICGQTLGPFGLHIEIYK